jgi:hypothetical protein
MDNGLLVAIIIAVIILVLLAVVVGQRRRTQRLQQRFGPEYERTVTSRRSACGRISARRP